MTLFLISIILGITTILLFLRLFKLDLLTKFFAFFPLLFVYIESISFILSTQQQLTGFCMLCIQGVLFLGTFWYSLHRQPIQIKITHRKPSAPTSLPFVIGICCCVSFIILSALLRFYTPTRSFDDVSYRAAAPMHWLQTQSVYRTPSLSEHGNVFLYGTGIYYLWPFLFTTNETTATLMYWLAFPILCLQLYFFTKVLTKRKSATLLSLALFITAPILYRHVSLILIQELWLGVVLISSVYLLYKTLTQQPITHSSSMLLGVSFAVLPQLKPTGWFFTLFLFILFLRRYRKNLLSVFFGFVLSLILSGYPIILYQNYLLYGSPGGTPDFSSIHLASVSLHQLLTHIVRIPFLLIKLPCYTIQCFGLDPILQPLSVLVGATKTLPYEATEGWIGTFQYLSSDPDRNFGFGGVMWFFLLCTTLWYVFTSKKQRNASSISAKKILLFLFSGIFLFMLFVIRWEDTSGVPYKHLISLFSLACLLGVSSITWKRDIFYYLLSFGILCYSLPLAKQTLYEIHLLQTDQMQQAEQELRLTINPYASFLETLSQPSTFLVIGTTGVPNYSLYFLKKEKANSLYFFIAATPEQEKEYTKKITEIVDANTINYIITPNDESTLPIISHLPLATYIATIPFEDAKVHLFRYNRKN